MHLPDVVTILPRAHKMNRIVLHDLDPRIVLSSAMARELARQLIDAADKVEREGL